MSPRAFIRNLGCPKNEVDGDIMAAYLERCGFMLTDSPERADLIVVNTCGFVREAKEESIREILDLARYKANGSSKTLVVAGCLAQRYMEELAAGIPEVDHFLGIGDLRNVANTAGGADGKPVFTGRLTKRYQIPDVHPVHRHRSFAYLKISDGCDNRCSYCAIPSIRGRHRSRPMADIVAEAEHRIALGTRELVLVAQDTTAYGLDLYGKRGLPQLLRRLSALDGRFTIRIMYAHPKGLDDNIICALGSGGPILPYVDVPLQHISDRILSEMNRRVTSDQIRGLIVKLRESIPEVVIRTTYLVGYPGETSSDFEKLLRFQEEFGIERVGVFAYSPEEGTKAYCSGTRVRDCTVARRIDALMNMVQEQSLRANAALVGTVQRLLVDGPAGNEDKVQARMFSQAPEVDGSVSVSGRHRIGSSIEARITAAEAYDLHAEPI